ncbi:MAG: hypothetical protein R3D55_28275 [Chloroflexota bacterium]
MSTAVAACLTPLHHRHFCVLEWIESGVVRRAEDVERYLEIPVVGRIPGQ